MRKNRLNNTMHSAKEALMRKKSVTAVYLTLRLMVILVMVAQFFHGNFENVFLCILTLILYVMDTDKLDYTDPDIAIPELGKDNPFKK